jgi:transcriptional regulator with XRE-family HTH domain
MVTRSSGSSAFISIVDLLNPRSGSVDKTGITGQSLKAHNSVSPYRTDIAYVREWIASKLLCHAGCWRTVLPNDGGGVRMGSPLGDRLRELRKGKGLSLERLAEATGSSKSYLWELENRDVPRPSGEKLAALARALDTTVGILVDDKTDPEAAPLQDQVFFRKFQELDKDSRERIRQIVDSWRKPT